MKKTTLLTLCTMGACYNFIAACGDDAAPTCTTKSSEFRICDGNKLYSCPVGDGSQAEMVFVADCSATGETCIRRVPKPASCVDPNHVVGGDAAQYSEQDEAGNNDASGAEDTGYTLDEKGLVISGALDTSDADHFTFAAGSFTRFDMQILQGGKKGSGNLTIDAVNDDGYSKLTTYNGYFVNGGLPKANASYVVKISSGVEGPYTLELKGNP